MSWNWCWPAGGWGCGPGSPGASAGSLVGRARFLGLWLQGLGVLKLVSVCWCVGPVPDMAGYAVWGVPKLASSHW